MQEEIEVLITPGSFELLLKKNDALEKENEALRQQLALNAILEENQKVTEKALCKTQETLRHALEATRDGIWDLNVPTGVISFTPQCYTVLGYNYNDFSPTREHWHNITHPDDLQNVIAFGKGFECIDVNEAEFRVRTKSGEWRWICIRGKIVDRDENGKPLRTVGTFSDINQRKQMEESLRESEAHLNEAQRLAHIGSWNWDVINNKVTWSEELYTIMGMDPGQPAPGYSEHKKLMPHKSWVNVEEIITHTLLTGEPFEIEIEAYNSRNELCAFVYRGAAIRSEKGKVVRIYGTVQDITEQKRAEDKIKYSLKEKEILLKEIHHRVKNNMQVITSLLKLQASQFQDTQLQRAFEQLQNRIRSMALVHEKLYASGDMSYIAFGTHTRNIINHLVMAYGSEDIKVEMEVDEVKMDLSKAIPASLILNELVTNALIHGFPDRNAGSIKVSLQVANGNNVTLKIYNNGKGFPEDIDINNISTLGLTLVTALLDQIDGVIGVKRENGTTFTIRFKLTG